MGSFQSLCESESSYVTAIGFPALAGGVASNFGTDKISTDNRARLGNSVVQSLHGATAMTIVARIRPSEVSGTQYFCSFRINGVSTTALNLGKTTSRLYYEGRSQAADGIKFTQSATGIYQIDTWIDVSAVIDFTNDNVRFGFDGSYSDHSASFGSDTADFDDSTSDVFVGQGYNGGASWPGETAAVAMFNAALSDATIEGIFAADSIYGDAGGGAGASNDGIMSALSMST